MTTPTLDSQIAETEASLAKVKALLDMHDTAGLTSVQGPYGNSTFTDVTVLQDRKEYLQKRLDSLIMRKHDIDPIFGHSVSIRYKSGDEEATTDNG